VTGAFRFVPLLCHFLSTCLILGRFAANDRQRHRRATLGFKNALGSFNQAHDLSHHIALRHSSWPVPEQDLAVAEGGASGLEAMAERVAFDRVRARWRSLMAPVLA
jgi:hypothetical protein